MFERVEEARFVDGEHQVLRWWGEHGIFAKLLAKNAGGPKWSFLDGPITANNPMGVHHAWGRTYKDAYQRYRAMTGHELRYQNGFDCQGLWVEVEVEKEMGLGTKTAIAEHGIDKFVQACKRRVLTFAARQTEQSVRLGYWMEWDDPSELRKLAAHIGEESEDKRQESEDRPSIINHQPSTTYTTARGQTVTGSAEEITAKLGNPQWGGSYFTFSTENNETIWTFLKKCFERGKIYLGHDVMPWGGRAGSAYSQMEIADGRKLTTHRSCFVRFPITEKPASGGREPADGTESPADLKASERATHQGANAPRSPREYLLVWTTTPWTLTSNVAAAVNPDLDYVRVKAQIRGDEEPAYYYFAKENLDFKRLEREFKEGFGRPEWSWPDGLGKLKSIAQIFKEQGKYEVDGTVKGTDMIGWRYAGPFDDLEAQQQPGGYPSMASGGRESADAPEPNSMSQTSSTHQGADAPRSPSGVECHRVIDGGRDFKGNPHVVAGEGTGIVHIAPGCGDVDHQIGQELGLVSIAPLKEDGTFGEGFGPFTGKEAINPATADLVFDELKRKGLLVYVEEYPHVYPHCWRTGEELVFRLVDEWFINMDWREEIKEVTRAIEWLPGSINGQEREVEWLNTMRDWMISKKRFWGLALPIWVEEDDPTKFQVFGSIAELKDWYDTHGGEGWEQFEGHTPHRPWIDAVRIRNRSRVQSPESSGNEEDTGHSTLNTQHTGNWMRRVEDVGNPWLDAGITPFSTMNYREWKRGGSSESGSGTDLSTLDTGHSTLDWDEWYPADFVTECFPGQFRNWFYSLLALSTMMRYDEADDPQEKRPFKTLLGHRLVMDETGQPMHKSDGTAIWFEEAAEQLGVDTLRWMYLAQNPAADLRFGTRHPHEPVTLDTPEGPISETKEGLPTVKVTSKPADEIRRQVLIPLWNSYAFFVNYAVADEFDPTLPQVSLEERPQIDRWVLSRLQELIGVAHESFEAYDVARFMQSATAYIDDVSNWYIRRNRRRFWRSRGESAGESSVQGPVSSENGNTEQTWESDKLAAYQTLYEVLLTLTKLLAPCVPFIAERMYQNLTASGGRKSHPVASGGRQSPDDGGSPPASIPRKNPEALDSGWAEVPESVHLCDYPTVDDAKLDPALNRKTSTVQTLVRLGHRLRESAELRVRQPLAELRFATGDAEQAADVEQSTDIIADELNVKLVTRTDNLDDLVSYSYKPNLKTLGPKYGKLLGVIRKELPEMDGAALAPLRNGEPVTVMLGGEEVRLEPDDVLVSTEQASEWASGDDGGIQVALSTALTPELIREGMARDFVRHVQQARKDAGLKITDRIRIGYVTEDAEAQAAIKEWSDYIMAETLADSITLEGQNADAKSVTVGDARVMVGIERA